MSWPDWEIRFIWENNVIQPILQNRNCNEITIYYQLKHCNCKKWVHHKYNKLSDSDFKYSQNNKDFWYCIKCTL